MVGLALVLCAELAMNWRVSPHCRVVNLVRSGRKQPQLHSASAGGKARLLLLRIEAMSVFYCAVVSHKNWNQVVGFSWAYFFFISNKVP